MISQTVNGLERRVYFQPGYHKVHEDPKKNYGVHGMSVMMLLIGPKGAIHFSFGTGMMLKETYEWWEKRGLHHEPYKMHMGYDVGYHSPKPMYEGQELRWPTKMRKTGESVTDVEFDKVGKEAPNCEWLGVPCYCDGSAMRAEEWEDAIIRGGDDKIWEMLEEEYKLLFEK